MEKPSQSILILGAYGFIGSAIANALSVAGHRITGFGRDTSYGRSILPEVTWHAGDLGQYCTPESWSTIIRNIDVVINASGVLQSSPGNNVTVTQADAIIALAKACEMSGIVQFIQISACGASDQAEDDFMQSKAHADRYLLASSMTTTVLRPGLVIGRNSYGGTELIRMVAALPGIAIGFPEFGKVQSIALSDVVEAVLLAIAAPEKFAGSYVLVEAESRSLDQIVALHRQWLGIAPTRRHILAPMWLVKLAAAISDGLGWMGWRSPLRSNAIHSLAGGIVGDIRQTREILGRPAMALDQYLSSIPAGKQDRIHARLMLLLPLSLSVLVLLWLGSGILGLIKVEEAASLLAGSSLSHQTAELLVLGGALGDLALGFGLLFRKCVRLALVGTILLSAAYLIGGTLFTPELWLDPLAPLIKALAAMGLSLNCLIALDKR